MELEGSIPCSEVSATELYPEAEKSHLRLDLLTGLPIRAFPNKILYACRMPRLLQPPWFNRSKNIICYE
jgi:hypothetical protein